MKLIINHREAALKKGTSFEYVSENRLFTDSDNYTLSITLPLAGCAQNLAIFGNIDRLDVSEKQVVFDAEIHAPHFHKYGSVVVVEVAGADIKVQFLEGRSEQNFLKTLDSIYIDELTLGYPDRSTSERTPEQAWQPGRSLEPVALPWINEGSISKDYIAFQNGADYTPPTPPQAGGTYSWSKDTANLSFQPYLLRLTEAICQAVRYKTDFSAWEEREELRYLLVCNTLPQAWDIEEFARALPHWSVEEYLQKLALLLGGDFDIDHRGRSVTFSLDGSTFGSLPAQTLERIVDEVNKELTSPAEDEDSSYRGVRNREYKECSYNVWKFYSCQWLVDDYKTVKNYDTLTELLADTAKFATYDTMRFNRPSDDRLDALYYARDVDAHFMLLPVSRWQVWSQFGTYHWVYKCVLRPVNLLGPAILNDNEDADTDELDFVPVCIDDTDEEHGPCMFLSFGDYAEDDGQTSDRPDAIESGLRVGDEFYTPAPLRALNIGEKSKSVEYYDRIYIAWWDGATLREGKLPHPLTEEIEVEEDFSGYRHHHFSLRLNGSRGLGARGLPRINARKKVTVKFLSDRIPNVMAPFIIRGKRYLCSKITATFTEEGMSELLKGEFYPESEA